MSPEVTVIGCDGRPFGPEAAQVLAAATLVIGAPRHLEAAPIPDPARNVPRSSTSTRPSTPWTRTPAT